MKSLRLLCLLVPTLLLADVDPSAVTTTPAPAPAAATPAPAPKADLPTVATIELRLKPSLSAPVVLTLPQTDVSPSAQDAGSFEGKSWKSVEKPVTLTGYVEKSAVDKNLDVAKGATVWSDESKTSQLTVVDEPSAVKVLSVEKLGRVELTEPRVLYYPGADAPLSPVTPVAESTPAQSVPSRVSAVPTVAGVDSMTSLEGVLKKGNPLLGARLYLVDVHGNFVANIDPKSPVDRMSMEGYLDKTAAYTGVLKERGGELTLTVRMIRLE
jgi:hypothetical protein